MIQLQKLKQGQEVNPFFNAESINITFSMYGKVDVDMLKIKVRKK